MYIVYMLVLELFEGYSGNLIIQATQLVPRPSSAPVYLIFEKPILRLMKKNGIMEMPLVILDSCHWSFFYIWLSYTSAYVLLLQQINNGMLQSMQSRGLICILHFCKALEQTIVFNRGILFLPSIARLLNICKQIMNKVQLANTYIHTHIHLFFSTYIISVIYYIPCTLAHSIPHRPARLILSHNRQSVFSNRDMCSNWNALLATAETKNTFITDEDSIMYRLAVLFPTGKGIGMRADAIKSYKQADSLKLIKYAYSLINDL